ncbi:hypothetical protein [Thermococcus henrietii]|uniref:hypothetical protein n=1 Tax=Thermococcus henrietii TaxID=2016361 RepID=UPI0011AB7795|nr:hypothetical protein [Thermococcus henrietii]
MKIHPKILSDAVTGNVKSLEPYRVPKMSYHNMDELKKDAEKTTEEPMKNHRYLSFTHLMK